MDKLFVAVILLLAGVGLVTVVKAIEDSVERSRKNKREEE